MNIIVKLRDGAKLDAFSESNIAEYRQAQDTIQTLERMIIEPYTALSKDHAKREGTAVIFDNEGFKIKANTTISDKHYSASELVRLLDSTIQTARMNQENGKQMYGVRKFGDSVSMQASYLLNCLDNWQEIVLDKVEQTKLTYSGAYAEIAKANRGNLILGHVEKLDAQSARLYIAAREQTTAIDKHIITPFEEAFKSEVKKDPTQTLFTNMTYGGLIVQVKTVPRPEVDYKVALRSLRTKLEAYATQTNDSQGVFINQTLVSPSAYVSLDKLEYDLSEVQAQPKVAYRQEIRVLYKPESAFILADL
jgi:hypothetical protein